tara:strand:- start:2140 stop:2529 length:390 start_codon:yes stop_codon:yes gene_type:complete
MKKHSTFNLFVISILVTFFTQLAIAQPGSVTVNADSEINELLILKKSLEKENKMDQGFTIQLFYGDLEQANISLKQYRNLYGSWPASIEYETPNYKVWAGNFATRIEADRALIIIKKKFSSAFIIENNM